MCGFSPERKCVINRPKSEWRSQKKFRYILIAISEIFASITGLEYAFTKAPKNMRSLVMSAFFFMSAISSALGEAFVCKPISFTSHLSIANTVPPNLSVIRRSVIGVELRCDGCSCFHSGMDILVVCQRLGQTRMQPGREKRISKGEE